MVLGAETLHTFWEYLTHIYHICILAQSVKRTTVNLWVAGSNPALIVDFPPFTPKPSPPSQTNKKWYFCCYLFYFASYNKITMYFNNIHSIIQNNHYVNRFTDRYHRNKKKAKDSQPKEQIDMFMRISRESIHTQYIDE